ncbi:hypothetical protein NM688_g792 [Phlebia brevispora]|uniref:Uncharacterized protein n=1 Tax=Phlebia brevispora TaxID=194682 RepID=A0ACC1TD48_9APHY|nr:hypothetical protein NM688_g792 [Phlebia brevispora]
MDDDYYSIDAILAENQKIQCTFKKEIPNMGHLTGGNERDIKPTMKAQIPVWLARTLFFSGYADLTMPPAYAERVRHALDAEATSVKLSNLVGQGGLWYGFGRLIMNELDDDSPDTQELSKLLATTFKARLPAVVDQAQHFASINTAGSSGGGADAGIAFREGLDGTERELFNLAQESAKRTKLWYESSDRGRR